MKGLVVTNKYNFVKFGLVRLCLQLDDFMIPFMMIRVLDWIQKPEPEPISATVQMVFIALSIPFIQVVTSLVWEFFCFQMIELGHRTHTALKVMLFRKNFKMTGATNKDFSSGEINHIIMGESNRIWDFIWGLPDYVECPLQLCFAVYMVWTQIGWCGAIVLFFTGLQIFQGYVRGQMEKDVGKKQHEKH